LNQFRANQFLQGNVQPIQTSRPIIRIPSATPRQPVSIFPRGKTKKYLIRQTEDFQNLMRNNNLNLQSQNNGIFFTANGNRNGGSFRNSTGTPVLLNNISRNSLNNSQGSGNVIFNSPNFNTNGSTGNLFTVQRRQVVQPTIIKRFN
jgi:hypothetical protein